MNRTPFPPGKVWGQRWVERSPDTLVINSGFPPEEAGAQLPGVLYPPVSGTSMPAVSGAPEESGLSLPEVRQILTTHQIGTLPALSAPTVEVPT